MDWPRAWTWRVLAALLPICLPAWCWSGLALVLTGNIYSGNRPVVPFWAALLSALPTFGVVGLSWLLWRLEREAENPATVPIKLSLETLSPLLSQ